MSSSTFMFTVSSKSLSPRISPPPFNRTKAAAASSVSGCVASGRPGQPMATAGLARRAGVDDDAAADRGGPPRALGLRRHARPRRRRLGNGRPRGFGARDLGQHIPGRPAGCFFAGRALRFGASGFRPGRGAAFHRDRACLAARAFLRPP